MWQSAKSFLLKNTATRQTIAKNTFWLAVSNVGGRLLRAIIIVYAARVLGAAEWGAFSYAVTLTAMLTILTDFGVNSILTREVAKRTDPGEQARYLATALLLKFALLIPSALFILLAGPTIASLSAARTILPIVALILAFDTIRDFAFAATRAYEKMELEARAFLFTNAAITIFGFIFLLLSPTITAFAWGYAAGAGLGALAALLPFRGHLRTPFAKFQRNLVRPILASAWPFALSGLLGGLMINTDIILIGFFRSAEEVGFYSAAQRIILLLYIIPGALATSIFPLLARLAHQDNEKARRLTETTLALSFLAAFPIMVGSVLLAPGIITTLFGAEYLPGAGSFAVLALTLAANFAGIILGNVVFAYDRQRYLVVYSAVGATLNIILDIILIPRFGIIGSAIATFCVQIVVSIYLWTVTKRLLSFSVFSRLGPITCATVVMGLSVWTLNLAGIPTIFTTALGGLTYLVVLLVLREPLLREARTTLLAKNSR